MGMDAYKKKDFTTSLVFFIKASNEGSKESMLMVAMQYARGEGVAKDSATYVMWLNKAAKAGNDYAMYSLGVMYDNGRYLPKDSILALQWYVKGAQAGNSNCQNNLGVKYSKGRWVTKDYARALELFRKSAEGGNGFGMGNLGDMYAFGRGVQQNDKEALNWYQKAYEKNGLENGAYQIAIFYEEGKGGLPKDGRAAMQWFQKANRTGEFAGAMQHIGYLYQHGLGVSVDTAEARRWYLKAAAMGNAFAMYYLGTLETDEALTIKWNLQAEQAFLTQISRTINDTESMLGLATMYEHGKGVVKQPSVIQALYQRAADWGDEEAKKKLK
jgi:TPR repeat protein